MDMLPACVCPAGRLAQTAGVLLVRSLWASSGMSAYLQEVTGETYYLELENSA